MASSTSPDGIVFPDASDPIAPLNAVFQDLAESVQTALDGIVPPEVSELNDIGDVVITSPQIGQSLVYDGDNWVNALPESFQIEYLVVAGGGGGGARLAGGGGAGGYRANVFGENSGGGAPAEPALVLANGVYALTVGAGGTGSTNTAVKGGNGANSVFGPITSTAGGGGGSQDTNAGLVGGSGGGGARNSDGVGGAGTTNQGFAGGIGIDSSARGGGGGGASAVGVSGGVSGNGGNGVASSITGTSVTRAGGGGGGTGSLQPISSGGSGGGGNGGQTTAVAAQAGVANTGGGGGGDGLNVVAANGGSGVVIIKVNESRTVTFSGGVTETNATDGGFTVYTVTAAGPTDTVTIG